MDILISGSTGMIGTALNDFFTKQGHKIKRLVRKQTSGENDIFWDAKSTIEKAKLEGLDAAIHLAGESIRGRWTTEKKAKIRNSRSEGTRLLAESLATLSHPPRVFICASGINYYGNRSDEILKEDSSAGEGFLVDVCREWESAAMIAAEKGIRVASTRFGMVLSKEGGALKQMLLPFKLGIGGKVGSGKQYYSWIAIDDLVAAMHHIIITDSLQGPINFVSPNPLQNSEFTQKLAKVLHRPAIFPLPTAAVKIIFGEMGDELVLASMRVEPAKLLESIYPFRYPELEGALRHILDK